jgi:hypothetical protein
MVEKQFGPDADRSAQARKDAEAKELVEDGRTRHERAVAASVRDVVGGHHRECPFNGQGRILSAGVGCAQA